jgi:peptidoglycan-N-acetylglucosamine deacetylase
MRRHLLVDVPLIAAAVSLAPVYGVTPLLYVTGIASAIHTWGVLNPRSSLYMPVWWRLPRNSPAVALTFDDGPHPETTPRVLDALAAHQQRATFFIIGENVRRYPAIVRRIINEGHRVGLHSDQHSWLFNCWPQHLVRRDLLACANTIADCSGQPAPRLFRPPIGLKNPIVGSVAGQLQLRTVTWSCRALDTGNKSVPNIVTRVKKGLRPRAIITMHDGHEPSRPRDTLRCVNALNEILLFMKENTLISRALQADEHGISCAEK